MALLDHLKECLKRNGGDGTQSYSWDLTTELCWAKDGY